MEAINIYAAWMVVVFVIGYMLITVENYTGINKAAVAVLMAIFCWVLQFASDPHCVENGGLICFSEHLASISQLIFFILGALTIIEIVNAHQGFKVILNLIQIASTRKCLWIVGIITFFLSSVLDNLTTTIVMITLLRQLIDEGEDRLIIGSGVVIAANAGGAWTPIGDLTTTMLWIGEEISTLAIMRDLFLPSIACMVVSFLFLSWMLRDGPIEKKIIDQQNAVPFGNFVFFAGIALLIFVPFFKYLTNLPAFMGIIFGLGVLWILTDYLHRNGEDKNSLSVPHALSKIEHPTIFFFLGILLAVDALDAAHILAKLAVWLDQTIGNVPLIATLIGLVSAVVDNVPLVAAAMGMYPLSQYPQDSAFWELIAYCAGTGGSILIIGSAAGVVFMGLEKVDFFWYLRRISLPALLGYLAGIGVYLLT